MTRAHDLRQMGGEDLASQLDKLTVEISQMRQAIRTGKEKDYSQLKTLRNDLARIKTVLQEQSK